MPFDGVVTRAVTNELKQLLIGGRITKIHQPTATELRLTIRQKGENFLLLLSAHPNYARFHLTDESLINPETPPMFCMHLRKYLLGGFIRDIKQDGLERIVTFTIQARDEIGDATLKHLTIELMGRHSNILLLDENKQQIIDCIKHISPSQNRYRTLLPGQMYKEPPPQNKLNPLETDGDEFLRQLDFNAGQLDRQVVKHFSGISPFLAKEIVARAHLGELAQYKKHFLNIQSLIQNHEYEPTIYHDKQREDFHVVPITTHQGEQQSFTTTQQMLDTFFSGKAARDRIKQQANDLQRLIKNELSKNKRKLNIHKKTIKRAKQADKYQRLGELLTAHLHLVKQGDPSIKAIDYYDPEQKEISIRLQEDLTPSENAQRYFTRYRKLKASEKIVTKEIQKTRMDIDYLERILQQVESARTEDLADIREELREEGYLREQKRKQRRKIKKPQPELFIASDGTEIYVGKNNRQNEYLTRRLAHRDDVWLHTKDIPGSHVVIRSADPSEKTLFEAAELAAYFSQAKHSASVPVDYTHVRHVKKPSGAKPGFVIYTEEKTLFVTPKESTVKQLKEPASS
ncbi:MAG TPA: NFACT RNA binding domain-containing protein [Bacillota bacterium]|nr:NFACT RNA binding domain-containing protein [Bacillota bacterium]